MKKEIIHRDKDYFSLLSERKSKIHPAQIKAAVVVNKELLSLYWEIGKTICGRQKEEKYGDSIVEMLAVDLKKEFSDLKGFSRTDLFYICQWYLFYSKADQKVQQAVGQLPWGHNERDAYIKKESEDAVPIPSKLVRKGL